MRSVPPAARIPVQISELPRPDKGYPSGEAGGMPPPLDTETNSSEFAAADPVIDFKRSSDAPFEVPGLAVAGTAIERAVIGGGAEPSWASLPPGFESVLARFGITFEAEIVEAFARGGKSGKPTDSTGGGKGPKKDTSGGSDGDSPIYAADYVSGLDTPHGFNIELVFNGEWADSLIAAFVTAAERLSDLIIGDLPTHNGIDDIRITATLATIDGPGGVVGSGGAASLRTGSLLPATGYMRFDSADALNLLGRGMWEDLVLHEMMHAIGFGGLWSRMGLVTDYNGDLRFTGANATEQYNFIFASLASADPLSHLGVPVETDFGAGTAGVHWDEAAFRGELMTGRLNGSNYLSAMSVAALEDMGYSTILGGDALFV